VIQKADPPRSDGQEMAARARVERHAPDDISASSAERKEGTGKIVISRNGDSPAHQNLVRAAEPEGDARETRLSGQGEAEKEPPQSLKMRAFHTMTLEELQDKNSSWHPVEGYRVYLAAEHRYYGAKNAGDLFPLWVYEGELAPEFLDLQKAWKFYDRLPVPHGSLEALPAAVARFLLDMTEKKASEPTAAAAASGNPAPGEPAAQEAKKEDKAKQAVASAAAPIPETNRTPETKTVPAGGALPATKREWIFAGVFRLLKNLLGL
jgi:hypothetical protein